MINRKKSNPNNKSTSPITKSLSAKKLSKTQYLKHSASPKIPNIQTNMKQNSQSRQKLAKTLDTYTLLIRSNNPIRCLVHNCNISMYCQTQQKLLCANCIFGRNDHKFHRVSPADKSYDKIQKDVQTMNRLIDRELQAIKNTGQNVRKSLSQDEEDTHAGLASLIKIYQECHRLLQDSFLKSKEKILLEFQKQRSNFQQATYELKKLFEDYGMYNILQNVNKQPFKKDQLLLYQHSVSNAISSQKKFNQKDYISDKRSIQASTTEEKKKIFVVLDLLRKVNSSSK